MSDKILSAGQPSIEHKYGEETKKITVILPLSIHQFATDRKARGMSASELIRQLLAAEMAEADKAD